MPTLIFDTETTGLPSRGAPLDHASQPHLVQLAAVLLDDDGVERACVSLIVRPAIPIPPDAAKIHGISEELAARVGVPPAVAVGVWSNLARRADLLVAHNIAFDIGLMATAWLRTSGRTVDAWQEAYGGHRQFCTMKAATPVVNLPPTERMVAAGFNRPKPPKLEECIRHFFDEDLAGAHDALVDVRACARVFNHLRKLGNA